MPYPPKQPGAEAVRGFGVTLDAATVSRIDALTEVAYPAQSVGRRSQFLRDLIELGLVYRFGVGWRDFADELIARSPAPADREPVPV